VTFTYVLTKYLIRFTPSIILPHPSPSFSRTISASFIVVFSYTYTKSIHHIHPPSPSLFTTSLPVVPTSRQDLFYLCILVVQGGFTLVFYTCIDHILIGLIFSMTLSPAPYYSAALLCIIFFHRCIVFQYYSLSITLFSSPTSS
jgi:hypothetical protein